MSFICDNCGTPQTNGAKPNRWTSEIRTKIYPVRKDYRYTPPKIIDNGGKGWEIVREQNLCDDCYKDKP
jgi:hypothetical protein